MPTINWLLPQRRTWHDAGSPSTTFAHKSGAGFTIVEVLLYVSVSGILLISVSVLFALMLQARVDHEAVAEVEGQGNAAMQIMLQTIRNARAVNSPSTSTPSSTLSLTVVTSAYNPTIFTLTTGTLRMLEGSVASTSLTTNRIVIASTTFRNLTRSNTSGTVRVEFTARYNSSSTLGRTGYERTFIGSASLR